MNFTKGCLLPYLLTIFGGYWLLVLVLTVYSETFGAAAKNRTFIENNQLLASKSAILCRETEEDLVEDMRNNYRTKYLFDNQKYKLKSSSFNSIRFYDIDNGDRTPIYSTTGSYSGKNNNLSIDTDYKLALRWRRQFTLIGKGPRPMFFDPNYDFEVTCLLEKDPLKVTGLGHRMIGQ